MILTKVCGSILDAAFMESRRGKHIDYLPLDYQDAQKHILRAMTKEGRDIAIRLSPEAQKIGLQDGDVLLEEDDTIVVLQILPVSVLLAKPRSLMEAASFCYEIGNRHAPLYSLPGDVPSFAVLYDDLMEILFRKLGIPYEKKDIKLEDRYRLKLLSGTHHHGHTHEHKHEEKHHHVAEV